jgi:hypothetical protein
MSLWFRVYGDLVDDPKMQQLSADLFRGTINLWCLASKNDGILPSIHDIAFRLRKSLPKTKKLIADLQAADLIDETDAGLTPHNWASRQFKSDTSNERVKRFRERRRNVTSAVTETPSDTDTDTDTKTEKNLVTSEVEVTTTTMSKKSRKRHAYTAEFEVFWKGYPTDANMSKHEAFEEWQKLSIEERAEAIKSLPTFRAYCKDHSDYRQVHACRYLKKKRFEGHANAKAKAPTDGQWPRYFNGRHFIKADTDEWKIVEQHWRATHNGLAPPQGFYRNIEGLGSCTGYFFREIDLPESIITKMKANSGVIS